MAERTVVLKMTPTEEAALARLLGFLCKMESERGELSSIFGVSPAGECPSAQAIGRINAALNAVR